MNYTELNKQQKIDVLSIIVAGCPHINFQNSGKWLASKYEKEGAIGLIAEFSVELEEKYSDEYIQQLFSDTEYEDLVFDWTDLQLDYFFEYSSEVAIAIGDSYKKLGIEKLEGFDELFLLLENNDKRVAIFNGHQNSYSVLKIVDENPTEIYELSGWMLDVLAQSILDHELDCLELPYLYGHEFTFVFVNLDKFYQETGMSVLDMVIKRLDFEEKELGHQYSILKKYSENTELAA